MFYGVVLKASRVRQGITLVVAEACGNGAAGVCVCVCVWGGMRYAGAGPCGTKQVSCGCCRSVWRRGHGGVRRGGVCRICRGLDVDHGQGIRGTPRVWWRGRHRWVVRRRDGGVRPRVDDVDNPVRVGVLVGVKEEEGGRTAPKDADREDDET